MACNRIHYNCSIVLVKVEMQRHVVCLYKHRAACKLSLSILPTLFKVTTFDAPRTALAFKLRASPSAVLNLYTQLPNTVKPHIEPR